MFVYNSWTVLRSQCITDDGAVRHTETELSSDTCHESAITEWCSGADEWDEDIDDGSTCCINEMPAAEGQVSPDNRFCSELIANASNVNASTSGLLDSAGSLDATKSGDTSSDEPEKMLSHLKVHDEDQKPVSAYNKASTEDHCLSDTSGELMKKSNTAAELQSYYVCVIDEPAITDHTRHVEDLLTRYRLQEGGSLSKLESGNCT